MWRYLTTERKDEPVNAPLFLGSEGDPLNRHALLKLLIRLGAKAGVQDCHPHRFRHTFAVNFLRNGGNAFELQRWRWVTRRCPGAPGWQRVHLERGDTATVRQAVNEQLDALVGWAFEEICRSRVWELAAAGRIPFRPQRVGMWWDTQAQIDVAALDEEYILLGECHWRSRPLGSDALAELKRKAERVPGNRHQVLALFSRTGFTEPLQAEAASQGVLLFGLDDLLGVEAR